MIVLIGQRCVAGTRRQEGYAIIGADSDGNITWEGRTSQRARYVEMPDETVVLYSRYEYRTTPRKRVVRRFRLFRLSTVRAHDRYVRKAGTIDLLYDLETLPQPIFSWVSRWLRENTAEDVGAAASTEAAEAVTSAGESNENHSEG